MYNPRYYLPSISNVLLKLNLPPENCIFSLNPTEGLEFETLFNIRIEGCIDDDLPLAYIFYIYRNEAEYEHDQISS